MDLVLCPQCGAPATVTWSDSVAGSPAPVVMARVDCVDRHWFVVPAERLTPWPDMSQASARARA